MDSTAEDPAAYTGNPEKLTARARAGDREALAGLFGRYRGRLRAMVRIRMADRLKGRLDPSDVLQEAWLDVNRRFDGYVAKPEMPLFLWIRFLTAQKLAQLHRRHLGTRQRDAGREVRLPAGPPATSLSIAGLLVGSFTSPSGGAARSEIAERLREALEEMDETDREVLTLRHFEELTNNETALVLGLSKAAASNRYVRALKRLRVALGDGLDLGEELA